MAGLAWGSGEKSCFYEFRNDQLVVRNVLEGVKRSFWLRIVRSWDLFWSWYWVCPLVGIAQVETNCILGNNYCLLQYAWSLRCTLWLRFIFTACPSCLVMELLSGGRDHKVLPESDDMRSFGWTGSTNCLQKSSSWKSRFFLVSLHVNSLLKEWCLDLWSTGVPVIAIFAVFQMAALFHPVREG